MIIVGRDTTTAMLDLATNHGTSITRIKNIIPVLQHILLLLIAVSAKVTIEAAAAMPV